MWTAHQIHSSRLVHHSGTARTNFHMLFAFVSEGWTAREGYWRNTFYSSDYQRRFPLTLCIAIICNSYNGKYCCLYCKGLGFFCYRCEPLPLLSAITPRTLAKPGQGLNMKHHIKSPHKAKWWAGTKLCCQIGLAQKKSNRSSCDLAHAWFDQTLLLLQRQCVGRALADFLETRQSRSTVTENKLTH